MVAPALLVMTAAPVPAAKMPSERPVVPVPVSVPVIRPPALFITVRVPADSTAVPVKPVPPFADMVPEFVTVTLFSPKMPNVPFAALPEAAIVPVLVKLTPAALMVEETVA